MTRGSQGRKLCRLPAAGRSILTAELDRMGADPSTAEVEARYHVAALTPREREIIDLLTTGLMDSEIAYALGVAPRTVTNSLSKDVYPKLGVRNRVEAAIFWYRWGIAYG